MHKTAIRRTPGIPVLLPSCILALAVTRALALEPTGDLEVIVRDGAGAPLQSVLLRLTGDSLLGERTAVTGADGRFVFRALSPGTLEVDASKEGHLRIGRGGIVLDAGRTVTLPLILPEGTLEETVWVVAREPMVDQVRTTSQFTYDRQFLDHVSVGLENRSYAAVLNTAPTAVPETFLGNPQVRGATLFDNVFLVDGADTNDPVYSVWGSDVIYEAIDQVTFQTGALAPEFGRATGGVANVVTKSGGNEFSGSLDLRYTSGAMLKGGDHFDPDAITYSRGAAEAAFGGPVVRDKLWFFVAGGYYRSEDAPPESPVTAEWTRWSWLGKLTWQASPEHKLTFQALGAPSSQDNVDASPLIAPEATTHRTWDTAFGSVQYLGILGPNLLVQAQAGRYRGGLTLDPQSGDLETRCWQNAFDGTVTHNSCSLYESVRTRNLLTGSVTWTAGRHAIKGGIDLQRVVHDLRTDSPGGGWDIVGPDASGDNVPILSYDVVTPTDGQDSSDLGGYFVQDEWRIHPRAVLNLGVRYSTYTTDNDTGATVFRTHMLEPRLGIAWDPTGDGKQSLKATFSRFGTSSTLIAVSSTNQHQTLADQFANETVGGYFLGEGPTPADVNGDGTIESRAFIGSVGGPGSGVYAHGGDLDAPHTDEWTVSYERQFGPAAAAGATYVRRRSKDLIEDQVDPATEAYVIDNLPGLEQKYDGVELRFRGQWPRGQVQASYVWSRNRGNIDRWREVIQITPEYDFPATSTNRWGYLQTDARHAVKVHGFWTLPHAFEIGGGYTYHSGFPWTLERPVLPYGAAFPEGRGSRRLPHYDQLDLDLSRTFRAGGADIRLIVSILNVFNEEAVTAVNTLEGSAGEPLDYQRPRRFQVGMHVGF